MEARKPDLSGLSVLVLEDEAFIAFALKSYLEEAGAAAVTTAGSLQEAGRKLAEVHFDAAIVDARLPDGDGLGLAAELMGRNVAVVVHSGHATSQRDGSLDGAVFCAKPATPEEVLGAIKEARARAV